MGALPIISGSAELKKGLEQLIPIFFKGDAQMWAKLC